MSEKNSLEENPSGQSNAEEKSRLLWIDFLRGLASIGVVLFHSPIFFWIGLSAINAAPGKFSLFDRSLAYLSIPFHFTGSGVMLFFVLSGFCIHYPYAATGKKLFLPSYAVRRFLRIYPPYFFAVVFSVICEHIVRHYFGQLASPKPLVINSLFMLQNYLPPRGQLLSNAALWSLPVEVELYIFFPIFYFLLRALAVLPTMAIVTCVSACALALSLAGNDYIPGNLALYWLVWCAGALLAEWLRKDKLPSWQWPCTIVMAIDFVAAVACASLKVQLSICSLVWSFAYFMLVWWGLSNPQKLVWLKSSFSRPFLFLGLISYSLYLFHSPFFYLFGNIWAACVGAKPASYLLAILFALLAIIPAYFGYRFIEAPSHNLGRRLASWLENASPFLTSMTRLITIGSIC